MALTRKFLIAFLVTAAPPIIVPVYVLWALFANVEYEYEGLGAYFSLGYIALSMLAYFVVCMIAAIIVLGKEENHSIGLGIISGLAAGLFLGVVGCAALVIAWI